MDLPTLKRLSRNDPLAYKSEICSRLEYFYAKLETSRLRVKLFDQELASLASFLSSVSYKLGFGEELCHAIIRHLKENLNQKTRDALLTATFTLRSKKSVTLSLVLPTWLKLVELKDKNQKERLLKFLINDLVLSHKKGEKLNDVKKLLLDRLKSAINSSSEDVISIGRFVLMLLIKLFHKKIWRDQITANAMSDCILAFDKKIAAAGARLVLDMPFKRIKDEKDVPVTPVCIIDHLRDPHGFALTLLKRSCGDKVSFNSRLMLLNVGTRVIGHYKLIIPSVYPQIAKYLNPKQRMVTHILAYLLQATHELVPPDMLYPIVDILANHFIAYDRPNAVILTGLHTVKELLKRSPQCLNESMKEYIKDFIKYKHKDISATAKSIAGIKVKACPEYGQVEVHKGVEGEELLDSKKSVSLTRILGQKDFQVIKRLKYGELSREDIVKSPGKPAIQQSLGVDFTNEGESDVEYEISEDENENEIIENENEISDGLSDQSHMSSDNECEDSEDDSDNNAHFSCVDPEILKIGGRKKLTMAQKRAESARIRAEKKTARKQAISKHGKKQSLSNKVQARNKPMMMAIQSKKMKKKQFMNIKEKANVLKRHIRNLSKGRINKKRRRS